jgi:hypothetical protein
MGRGNRIVTASALATLVSAQHAKRKSNPASALSSDNGSRKKVAVASSSSQGARAPQASSSTSRRWSQNAVDGDTAGRTEVERAKPVDCGLLRFHAGRSLQQQQSGREEMSDGDDDDDDDESFRSSDSDSGTESGTDSDTSLKGAEMEAERQRRIANNQAVIDGLGVPEAVERLRKPKRTRRPRVKGAKASRRSERSTSAGAGPTAGGGDGEGAGGVGSARKKRRIDFPKRFTEFLKKFGYTRRRTAADGDCLFSAALGCVGVIHAEQAEKPDGVATDYTLRLRIAGCETAAAVVEKCDAGMPLWTFDMVDGNKASDQDAYRKELKQGLISLKEPRVYHSKALEYVIWALALLFQREIVVLQLLDNGELCGHFRLYGCRNGKDHVYRLDELQQVLFLEIGTLVLVREGPTEESGHFTYLRTSGGHGEEELSSSDRAALLMRIGAVAAVARTTGSGTGGSKKVRIAPAADCSDDELLPAPALKALNTPPAVQQPAVERSRAAVEAELKAEIAQLQRKLEKTSTELRRVDHELNQAAARSDFHIGGCAPPLRAPFRTVRRPPNVRAWCAANVKRARSVSLALRGSRSKQLQTRKSERGRRESSSPDRFYRRTSGAMRPMPLHYLSGPRK